MLKTLAIVGRALLALIAALDTLLGMDQMIGGDFETGLASLKSLATAR